MQIGEFTFKKILILRPDRIGDVILSTPVLKTLKKKYPHLHISFMVQPFLSPLFKSLPFIDELLYFEPEKTGLGFHEIKYFLELSQRIQRGHYDGVIHLQHHAFLSAATYWAGVPVRIGPLSKPSSYLFYNFGKKQKRSQVLKHEAIYNLDLLEPLGFLENEYVLETEIFLSDQVRENIQKKIQLKKSIHPIDFKKSVLVHAGMRGSALNWPLSHYKELIQFFRKKNWTVFLTAGEKEQEILDYFQNELHDPAILYFGGTMEACSLEELAALMSCVECVVAPSTGPLHMAVALNKKTISFYPQIKVQSSKRWGPFSLDSQDKLIFTPHNESHKMESILPEIVFQEIQKTHFLVL